VFACKCFDRRRILRLPIAKSSAIEESYQRTSYWSGLNPEAATTGAHNALASRCARASSSGVVPVGMSGQLKDSAWTSVNSLGGRWNWDFNNFGVTASISTTGVAVSDAQMTAIDAKIDDGDLTTGNFQKVGTRFMYILER